MKVIFSLLLSFSFLSFAHVGEKVTFDLWIDEIGGHVDTVMEVVSKQGTKYCVDSTFTYQGENQTDSQCVDADSFTSREDLRQIVQFCDALSLGVKETVSDPNGDGTLDVCKIDSSKAGMVSGLFELDSIPMINAGYVWLGDLPVYGIYRINDGVKNIYDLKSYEWAQ